MIYAVWEGYVKEVCQLYLQYIEKTVSRVADLDPAIIGYLWTPELRPLTGGLKFSHKTSIARLALETNSNPVVFHRAEKEINYTPTLAFYVDKLDLITSTPLFGTKYQTLLLKLPMAANSLGNLTS